MRVMQSFVDSAQFVTLSPVRQRLFGTLDLGPMGLRIALH